MALTDMARSPEEMKTDASPLSVEQERYPYGLRISLTEEELEKLDVDHSDWAVGNVYHIHGLAKVVGVSSNETEGGNRCTVQLQITHLAGPESEDEEDEEEEIEDEGEEYPLAKHGYVRA